MSGARLLRGTRVGAALSLDHHLAVHGPMPSSPPDLIDAVDRAGLRGRGGASYPTALKLRAVADARGPRAVVVNAAEGEPMSAKDRTLLSRSPHLVLDGALAAADAVGARRIVLAVGDRPGRATAALAHAIAERGARGITVARVPAAYLAGEESALIRHLDGGPLKPTVVPPYPSERGLRRRPTLVQNPETLAHLALIARHGPAWFRQAGTMTDPGTTLVTVSGAVAGRGVQEIAVGAALTAVLERAGGATEPLRAVLVGGYHGSWIGADAVAATTLDDDRLAGRATLAAGVIVALGASAPGSAVPAATACPRSPGSPRRWPTGAPPPAGANCCTAGAPSCRDAALVACPTGPSGSSAAGSSSSARSSTSTRAAGRARAAGGR
jgi:NADH:ubiquinone oxidoreductase subunit F (NADH-binding)